MEAVIVEKISFILMIRRITNNHEIVENKTTEIIISAYKNIED